MRPMYTVPGRYMVDGTGSASYRARSRKNGRSSDDSRYVLEHERRDDLRSKRCVRDAGGGDDQVNTGVRISHHSEEVHGDLATKKHKKYRKVLWLLCFLVAIPLCLKRKAATSCAS